MLELFLSNPMEMELRNVESPPSPMKDEVKIKLIYGGICGSDLGVFKGKIAHATYPLRPGHELIGTVVESGKEAKYKVGTRVVVVPNTFCGECDLCRKGHTNICPHKKSLGVNMDGGFSEEFIISSRYVLPIPDDLPNEKAVLIEPLAVIVHAFTKVNITQDTSVAIVGSGNEGMLAAALAYYLGARVSAIDINPRKHDLIRNIGDIKAVYPGGLINEKFDVVIEAAGTQNSTEQAFQLIKPGGSLILIGLTPEANFPVMQMVRNELTVYGTIIYDFPFDYLQTIEYLRDPEFNVTAIVSMILPVAQYQSAYTNALSGDYGKIVLDFSNLTAT